MKIGHHHHEVDRATRIELLCAYVVLVMVTLAMVICPHLLMEAVNISAAIIKGMVG